MYRVSHGLVQESPDDDRRVISVTQYHLPDRGIEALRHLSLRRISPAPGSVTLLVHHQPDLIAQIQLFREHRRPEPPDHVEAHRLDVDQLAAEEFRIVRHVLTNGEVPNRVRALQKNAPAI